MFNIIKNIDGKIMDTLVPKVRKIGIVNLLLIASLTAIVLMIILEMFVM